MANGGPPALQPPPVVSPVFQVQPLIPLAPPEQLVVPLAQPGPLPQLKWLHFKSEFAGKPDEDAEAHLLRTNDWIDTYAFQEDVKVQRFCLTLQGEAKMWYALLRLIGVDRDGLQAQFR